MSRPEPDTSRTIVAVGGHVGDMDLAAGALLAQNVPDGRVGSGD